MKPQFDFNEKFIEGNEIKLLEFELVDSANKIYQLALNIQKVQEVVEYQVLDTLPENFLPFVGMYNLRKIPVPVIDLLRIFNKSDFYTQEKAKRIIICDFQKMLVGIIVNRTKRVTTYNNSEVIAVPKAIDQTQLHLFNGIVHNENQTINLLDIEFILDSLHVNLGSTTESAKKFQKKMRALVAEDSRFFQKKIGQLFDKFQIDYLMAENGEEALAILEHENYNFDFVFTDIEMPKLNGIGFIRKLKQIERGSHLPVIFNTSLSNDALKDDITKNNLGRVIVKFDEETIFETINTMFNLTKPLKAA